MRKENSVLRTKFISEPGSYIMNQDYFAFVELEDYACYCIADGMDDDLNRNSAKLAVSAVITAFHENPGCSKHLLKRYMQLAHAELQRESREARLEVSIVVLLTDYKKALWSSAGNTRLFLVRNGQIKWRTKDTSLSQGMVEKGELPVDQLELHEERHNLYCYLGQPGRFRPLVSGKRKLEDGDIIAMYTRGVWESVGNAELLDAMEGASTPEDVCTGLEEVILSSQQDVVENYTIVSIFIDKVYRNPKANKQKKYLKIGLAIAGVVAALLFTLGFMRYHTNKTNYTGMNKSLTAGILDMEKSEYELAISEFEKAHQCAEKVKVWKNSKRYKKIEIEEMYYDMSVNLQKGREAFEEEDYKKCNTNYSTALSDTEELEDLGEHITFKKKLENLQCYAMNMCDGNQNFEDKNYLAAGNAYNAALVAVKKDNATAEIEAAEEKENMAFGAYAVKQGEEREQMGDDKLKNEEYVKAHTEFKAARSMYESAKNEYSYGTAADRIANIDLKINEAKEKMEKQDNADKEAEAEKYSVAAEKAMEEGDYETAQENFELAKEKYKEADNTEMMAQMENKRQAAVVGPTSQSSEQALQAVLSGTEYLSSGDYANALAQFQKARDAYETAQMEGEKSRVEKIITNLQGAVVSPQ